MRLAMLAPISWRVPPRHYGPWERVVSLLTEGLVDRGIDVTLFATADSITRAKLASVCPRPYSEDATIDPKVWEALHISHLFERASEFDLIHNNFDFLPLSYSGLVETPVVTTIHGFSSERIVPVYEKYNQRGYYVAISDADRNPRLNYVATVYHGISLDEFTLQSAPGRYLLFLGRIHHEKGVAEAIEVASQAKLPLVIAGIIQDQGYFDREVAPHLDNAQIRYVGSVGPEDRDHILGGAIALLHLINFAEPFGLSMIEAMACGVPVIARPRGSVSEIVRHGENGFIVETIDQAVVAVRQARELDSISIREYVAKNFSSARMAERYIEVYQEVLRMQANRSDNNPLFDRRPWGTFTVLDEGKDFKVKRIEVLPGKRLSYQKHSQRAEHWVVVQGTANVTIDDRQVVVPAGKTIDIEVGSAHRVENPGVEPLVFIEVQQGSYLGEDDIVRLQDDFGRAQSK